MHDCHVTRNGRRDDVTELRGMDNGKRRQDTYPHAPPKSV